MQASVTATLKYSEQAIDSLRSTVTRVGKGFVFLCLLEHLKELQRKSAQLTSEIRRAEQTAAQQIWLLQDFTPV